MVQIGVHSSILLEGAVPAWYRTMPEGYLNATKVNRTHTKLVWKSATVDHFPMWSRACQSEPYRAFMGAWM